MRQQYPFAYFVHCAAHRLNLVLSQAVSSISPVKVFFANVGYFSTFSTSSPHRKAFFMPTTSRSPVQVKPDGTIELVPLMASQKQSFNQ